MTRKTMGVALTGGVVLALGACVDVSEAEPSVTQTVAEACEIGDTKLREVQEKYATPNTDIDYSDPEVWENILKPAAEELKTIPSHLSHPEIKEIYTRYVGFLSESYELRFEIESLGSDNEVRKEELEDRNTEISTDFLNILGELETACS